VILGLMFFTAVKQLLGGYKIGSHYKGEDPEMSMQNMGIALSIFCFATGYQIVLPSVIPVMKHRHQSLMLVGVNNTVVMVVNIIFGVLVSLALMGTDVPSLSTLAWAGYGDDVVPRPLWTYMVESVIILFPAINMLSCGPLVGIVLAENLAKLFHIDVSAKTARVAVWIIPIAVTVFEYDLGVIVSIAGGFSIILNLTLGSVLFISSRMRVPAKSKYSGFWSSIPTAWFLVVLSLAVTILAFYSQLVKLFPGSTSA
jgi:amino acid permease